MLDLPMVRIMQAGSNNLPSVAEYYSSQLVGFVRRVLQVVPSQVFIILNKIMSLQVCPASQCKKKKIVRSSFPCLPSLNRAVGKSTQSDTKVDIPFKIEKSKLSTFAYREDNFSLARASHQEHNFFFLYVIFVDISNEY